MKQVQRFKCDYCDKMTAREETMERHEKECVHNPNSKNCYMCEFAYEDDYEDYTPWGGNQTVKEVPQCVYTEDVLCRGDAEKCDKFRRSKELYRYRDRKDAEENYNRLIDGLEVGKK